MKILILGAGMYVTGRDNLGVGTVLGSCIQLSSNADNVEITVVARREANNSLVQQVTEGLNQKLGLKVKVNYIALESFLLEDELVALASVIQSVKPSCAIVSTPDHLHYSQVKLLLELGIHTLCVKPLVAEYKQHQELIDIAEKNHVYGSVEFHKRLDESNLLVKRMLKDGDLGTVYFAYVQYSQRQNIPLQAFCKWVGKTNIFQYLGIHYVDLILWLTDAEPQRICVRGFKGLLQSKGIDTWDSVHVLMEATLPSGSCFLTHFDLSWIDSNLSPCLSNQKYIIHGSMGRTDVDQSNRGISTVFSDQPQRYLNPWFSEVLPTEGEQHVLSGYGPSSIIRFLEDVKGIISGTQKLQDLLFIRPSFSTTVKSTLVVENVNQLLETDNTNWHQL
jgi:predicted dehydrogenase